MYKNFCFLTGYFETVYNYCFKLIQGIFKMKKNEIYNMIFKCKYVNYSN